MMEKKNYNLTQCHVVIANQRHSFSNLRDALQSVRTLLVARRVRVLLHREALDFFLDLFGHR